ncbi:MAG TPA: hypothetical protein VNO14_06100, partial [Blastocatellia bacterium]|nr:hypothetical protein [Blastocatellia bacterium]
PANSPVSHVEPSRTGASVAYVSFDRHMFSDFRPHVFKTTDGGRTWRNITGNLPEKAYVHVVREDPKNPSLIYAGTELGLFASYTAGDTWVSLGLKNLPHVAVHDITVHPRENDLILATHGRSIWIFDDATPLQQMNQQIINSDAHLFDIRPAIRFTTRFTRYGIGDKVFAGPNPPYGALITYYLKDKPGEKTTVKVQVLDSGGKVIREIANVPKEQGLNRVAWDLRMEGARQRRPPSEEMTAFFGGPRGPQVLPDTYTVRLVVGDKTIDKRVEVKMDPTVSVPMDDLKVQHDLALKLTAMQSATTDALKALDSVKEQLQQILKTVKDRMPNPPEELTRAISDHTKQVDGLLEGIVREQGGLGLAGLPRLSDKLGGLFSTIEGVNAAPTPAQREAFNEVQSEFREKIAEVNRYINESVPKLNETLRKHNAPTVIAGKPVDIPR